MSPQVVAWGGVCAVLAVAIRLLGRVRLSLASAASGAWPTLLQLRSVAGVFVSTLAGSLIALGIAARTLTCRRYRTRRIIGAAFALLAVSVGLEALAGFFAGDQSPAGWPAWAHDVAASLGMIAFRAAFVALGILVVARVMHPHCRPEPQHGDPPLQLG